jgi:ubiquinone/menaquinone biosynthesis C-methylase UbiE
MKLNWAERMAVNNPIRVLQQKAEIRWFKQAANIPPSSTILEIGCGRGAGARLILREFHPRLFHASDLDLDMIRKATHYLATQELQEVRLLAGDVLHLPYREETLNAVFVFGVLHHVDDWRAALAEIARVLTPEGTFCFEELYPSLYQNCLTKHILLHPRTNRFQSDDLRAGLEDVGFSMRNFRECRKLGILAVAKKKTGCMPPQHRA